MIIKPHLFVILLMMFTISCVDHHKNDKIEPFNESEKQILTEFSNQLVYSINKYEYNFIRDAWDNQLFRKQVKNLSKTEQTVFDYYFEKELAKQIGYVNIDLVNKIKFNNGTSRLTKIQFFPGYAEINLSLTYGINIEFWKYRVELENKTPKLTDIYTYRDEIWQSDNVKNMMTLSSRFTAISKERKEANFYFIESEKYLNSGDKMKALELLYYIPTSHLLGNAISLKRISLAYQINDSVYSFSLEKEIDLNKSRYIRYLYSYYYSDTATLNSIYNQLAIEIGDNEPLIDSLRSFRYFWD